MNLCEGLEKGKMIQSLPGEVWDLMPTEKLL